jgi:hypothetical protein
MINFVSLYNFVTNHKHNLEYGVDYNIKHDEQLVIIEIIQFYYVWSGFKLPISNECLTLFDLGFKIQLTKVTFGGVGDFYYEAKVTL